MGCASCRRTWPTPSQRPRPASPAPRVRHLHAYACRIYVAPLPCKFRASMNSAISPRCVAFYPLPVRQASALPSCFLQTRSRPRKPLPSANSSPCRASRGLSPPSECALPGAPKKRQRAKHAALHKPPASGFGWFEWIKVQEPWHRIGPGPATRAGVFGGADAAAFSRARRTPALLHRAFPDQGQGSRAGLPADGGQPGNRRGAVAIK